MPRAPSAGEDRLLEMRIVADTNTVLSGVLWQGPPRQIVDAARAGTITLHTSLFLLAEFAEVIGRGKFARRIQRAELSAAALVADYRRLANLVEPAPLPASVSRDSDDDHVLACARRPLDRLGRPRSARAEGV